MTSVAVIVNPVSGGGRGKKAWEALHPGLRALFETVTYRITNHLDDMGQMVQDLLESKPDMLVVIGGDGTLHHAVNGYLEMKPKATQLAYFNAGCGGDFARLFPKQSITPFLESLTQRQALITNIGKIIRQDGSTRYFINVASCGFSALVAKRALTHVWLKKLGGTLHYFLNTSLSFFRFKLSKVVMRMDNQPDRPSNSLTIAICNGQYFGGNMHIAPMAKIDDGLLDVVAFENFSRLQGVLNFFKLYTGKHINNPQVHYAQVNKISIDPVTTTPIDIEADGEWVGTLPATFELLAEPLAIII